MSSSLVTHYKDINEKELGVLQRQFEKSYFFKHTPEREPKKLAIFDFDSTLFFSPLLSPTIWHPSFIGSATSESLYGPGWWRDIRSLEVGPTEELKKNAWEGFWNEKTVKEARECIADPDTMTVVLTGRRFHPFNQIIPDMLEAKELNFDLVGLRPDPEDITEHQWEKAKRAKYSINYNCANSVFKSTMHFKICFILNILHNVPSLKEVVMWDDRIPHVRRFREYLDTLVSNQLIQDGSVVYVPGIRPKYNPAWEKSVIHHIIEAHNKVLEDYNHRGLPKGQCTQRLSWPLTDIDPFEKHSTHLIGHEYPIQTSDKPLEIVPLPACTVITLTEESTKALYEEFKLDWKNQLEKNKVTVWEDLGGEGVHYFGNRVYLSQSVIPPRSINAGPLKSTVEIVIKQYSSSPKLPCLLLEVEVKGKPQDRYILPLWFKPSEYVEVFRLKDIHWKNFSSRSLKTKIEGKIEYEYRLGVREKATNSKRKSNGYTEKGRSETKRIKN